MLGIYILSFEILNKMLFFNIYINTFGTKGFLWEIMLRTRQILDFSTSMSVAQNTL